MNLAKSERRSTGRDVELGLIHDVFIRARPKSLRLGYLHWKKVTDSIKRKNLFEVNCIKHCHKENSIGIDFEKLKFSYAVKIKSGNLISVMDIRDNNFPFFSSFCKTETSNKLTR